MATQWMDDFSLYGLGGQNLMLNGLYAGIGTNCAIVADPDPSGTGLPVFKLPSNIVDSSTVLRRVLASAQTTVGVMGRFWMSALPVSAIPVIASFRDQANNIHGAVTCDPTGYIQIWRNAYSGGVLLGQSTGPVLTANAWKHIEVKWVCDTNGTDGSVEVRVEGYTQAIVNGVKTTSDTGGALKTVSSVGPGVSETGGGNETMYLKDFACWDGSGAINHDFLGACSIARLDADSDLAVVGWNLFPTAPGYSNLANRPPLDDTGYIEAPYPAPAASKFDLTNLPANAVVAVACQSIFRARKTDGGAGSMQAGLVSGGSTGLGGSDPLSTAWSYYFDPTDADPATSAAWTVPAVNALDLQLNRTV